MGNGSNTTTTNQASTYQPSPQAAGYINTALQNAQTASQAPFQQPVAPVAGFSPDQLAAFRTVNNAQGMANPYFTQASQLFGQSAQAPNVNQFFNPLAGAVGAQMQNLFGEQMSQTTGQLTNAAGGVGADRIAIGQGDLANQQGRAFGATMTGLYQPALQAALQEQNILQGAAYGYGALGPAAQNAVLTGAQAQLGTGGLQQQLSQAQLNAPYQQEMARLAYPFQTSNFLSNAVGSLAPGLGGTTWGGGQTTLPAPSMLSQIGGLGLAGLGVVGGTGGFGSNGWLTNAFGGGASALPYGSAIPGAQGPTSVGGAPLGYDRGGDVSDEPIDAEPQGGVVSQGQIAKISPHIPQINLNPPQQSGGGGKGSELGGLGSAISGIAKLATLANRGGTVGMGNPMFAEGYDGGGAAIDNNPFDDDLRQIGEMKLAHGWGTPSPDSIPGGEPAPAMRGITAGDSFNNRFGEDTSIGPVNAFGGVSPETAQNYPVGSPFNPLHMASPDAVAASDKELQSRDADIGQSVSQNAPKVTPNAFAPPDAAPQLPAAITAPAASAPPSKHGDGFANSAWLPLVAAGLGMAAGNSPFALQNIGQGGLTGLKVLEAQQQAEQKQQTIDQAAEKLRQEVKEHEDEFTRQKPITPYQSGELANKREELALKKRMYDSSAMSDDAIDFAVDRLHAGDKSALTNMGRGAQNGVNLTRIQNRMAERAANEGWSANDLVASQANLSAQTAAARSQAVRSANVETAINEAKVMFPQVEQASRNLPRGTSVPWNSLVQMVQKGTSDPRLADLVTAIQGARTAYSQALSRTGVNTVHAQEAADNLLSTVTSEEALFTTLRRMRMEMDAAKTAPEQTRQDILDRIRHPGGGGAAAPASGAAPAAPVKVASPEEARKLPKGTPIILPDGRTGMVP